MSAHRDEKKTLAEEGAYSAEILLSRANRRIQVLSYHAEAPGRFVQSLEQLGLSEGLGKVFMKARATDADALIAAGLEREAVIRGYFDGRDAHVLASYLDPRRRETATREEEAEILRRVQSAARRPEARSLEDGYALVRAEPEDSAALAELYATVFDSYPYPIDDPAYLRETMESHVVYALVRDGAGKIVAAASAETVPGQHSAEMTDFATLPEARCKGLAQHLLASLEGSMREAGIPNLYTIARALSTGMTRTFYNAGYDLTGTLVNNCHIAGRFETMHVWCKTL